MGLAKHLAKHLRNLHTKTLDCMFKRFLNGTGGDPPTHYALGSSDALVPPQALRHYSSAGSPIPSPTLPAPGSPAFDGYFDRRLTASGDRSPRLSAPGSLARPQSALSSPNLMASGITGGSGLLEPHGMDRATTIVVGLVKAVADLNELTAATAIAQKQLGKQAKELARCLAEGMSKQASQEDVVGAYDFGSIGCEIDPGSGWCSQRPL